MFCIRWFINRLRKKKPENLKGWISYTGLMIYLQDRLILEVSKIREKWPFEFFFFSYGEALCLFSRKNSFSHDLYSCPFVLILLFSKNGIVHGNVIFPFFSSLVWIKSFWNMGRKKKKKKKCEKFRCKWILLEFAWAAVKCRVLLYTG